MVLVTKFSWGKTKLTDKIIQGVFLCIYQTTEKCKAKRNCFLVDSDEICLKLSN